MKLNAGLHLAYCTNVHRGETWAETFASLNTYTLRVRDRVCPKQPYAIGLRLSNRAAHELAARDTLLDFQRWLAKNRCYVFTIRFSLRPLSRRHREGIGLHAGLDDAGAARVHEFAF